MRWTVRLAAAALVLTGLALAEDEGAPKHRVLVELFTSQG
jgi:hypothetical protein